MKKKAIIFFLFILLISNIFAGTTGKIAGTVEDVETGSGIAGVNIIITNPKTGLRTGASTDSDGYYFIINLPPGYYTVEASMVSYRTVTKKDVFISVDRTTKVNFELKETVITGEAIVITAERPLIEMGVTGSAKTVNTESYKSMPNIISFENIVAMQAGTVGEGRDIHIRGGRSGEISYMVDGIMINDPITGNAALDVDINSVEELDILTGGFNAEYGKAQSGVINIITKSGTQNFHGNIVFKSDNHNIGNSENNDYIYMNISGPELITTKLIRAFGLTIKEKPTFFIGFNGNIYDTYLNMGAHNPKVNILGLELDGRQSNRYNWNAKYIISPVRDITLKLGYRQSKREYRSWAWEWINIPDSTMYNRENTKHFTATITHALSKNTFYVLNLGYIDARKWSRALDMDPPDYYKWVMNNVDSTYEYVSDDSIWVYDTTWVYQGKSWGRDIDRDGFEDEGIRQYWRDQTSKVMTAKLDLTSQMHKNHQIKFGFELNRKKVQYFDIHYGGYFHFTERDTLPGPFPEYGLYRWIFEDVPWDGSVYIQDKMEYEGLVINVGLRADFFSPGKKVTKSDYREQWEKVTAKTLTVDNLQDYYSPRIGIGFPISEKGKIYFSYGHFTQMPDLQYLYRDPFTGTWIGNPNLKPQVTVAYEFGVSYNFYKNWIIDVKSFNKNISGYPGLIQAGPGVEDPGSPIVWLWVNKGYATTKGFEVEIEKKYSNYFSILCNYSYLISRGYSSSSFMEYYMGSSTPPPVRENRLDWDQTHNINLNFDFYVPKNMGPVLFGKKIDNWGINVLWKYGSGRPYTPYNEGTRHVLVTNTATMPYNSTLDIKINKDFEFAKMRFSIFAEILTAFNNRNVNYYGENPVNNFTGKPVKYGDYDPSLGRLYDWYTMKRMRNPNRFCAPRRMLLGLKINW